jgi:GR25 family glycosyltransferase involved in LPS biosynthesis
MEPFVFTKENTFCISLESNPKRWERMQNRFKNENLEVTRWIASTPDTLIDKFHSYLTPGECACAQSHINIWRHMLKNNIEYAFILEDDACFDKDWRNKLASFQIEDPLWDLVLLNALSPVEPSFMWVDIQEQYLTGGYILSIRGVIRLFMWYEGNFAASDWMTSRLQQNNHSYSYFPWLIIQDGSDSTLGKVNNNRNEDNDRILNYLGEIGYDISNYSI